MKLDKHEVEHIENLIDQNLTLNFKQSVNLIIVDMTNEGWQYESAKQYMFNIIETYIDAHQREDDKDKKKFDNIREYVQVDRKPFDVENLVTNEYNSLPEEIKQLLSELPIIEHKPDFTNDGFFEEFIPTDIQFCLVQFDERTFFVDTQGYNYARYVGEIVY